MKNVANEAIRSNKFTCSICKQKNAGLGCFDDNCKQNYHFKCALDSNRNVRIDYENFVVYCPEHSVTFDE